MKILIILFFIHFSIHVQAGEWTLFADGSIVNFKGVIEASDLAKFQTIFSDDIKKIVVDSGGGDAEIGLQIGELLYTKNIDVEVKGICMSSCANYIFTAGKRKILIDGIVGYHGNMTALMKKIPINDLIAQLKGSGASDVKIQEYLDHLNNYVLPREQQFFKRLGISQDLFDRTQREDKGMGTGVYSALLPKQATFEKYGILNVEGEQSLNIIKHDPRVTKYVELGAPVVID